MQVILDFAWTRLSLLAASQEMIPNAGLGVDPKVGLNRALDRDSTKVVLYRSWNHGTNLNPFGFK